MSKRSSRFRGKVAKSAHNQKQKTSGHGYLNLGSGLNLFEEEPGKTARLDLMIYEVTDPNHMDRDEDLGVAMPGSLWYKRPFKIHRNIGANNESVICLSTIRKLCPVCEDRKDRLDKGADWQDNDIKALRASLRHLYIVIPIGHSKYDEEPHVWDISDFCFQQLLTEELEENEDNEVFPDLEEGLTLRIRFSRETFGTNEFAKAKRIDFEERNEAYAESILDDVPNLDELLEILSYDSLKAKFMEIDEPEDDAGVTDDQPEQPPQRTHRKKKEEPKPDDEEVTHKSVRRKRKVSAPETQDEKPDEDEKKKCPHKHTFGTDCDNHSECDDCKLWEDCIEAQDKR